MATNPFFNNYKSTAEQGLIEDLVIESIKQYGLDVIYLADDDTAVDSLYGEQRILHYRTNYPVEMYVKNIEGFGGDGDFLSKFNIMIDDTMTLTVAVRQFKHYVGGPSGLSRPREGDLIYFPLNKKLFEVKFVEHEPVFYQMGALQMYDIKVELFKYNNQIFETGIADIDAIYTSRSLDTAINPDIDDADPVSDNTEIQTESDDIMDFTETDPFAEGGVY